MGAKQIPTVEEPGIFTEVAFTNEGFVEILSNDKFDVCMQYPLLHMKNAEKCCLVRREVYVRLLMAQEYLPDGYRIKILDAWRPFALQEELYNVYSDRIIKEFHSESSPEHEKAALIRKFVSEPIADQNIPPVHTTGGAVDVTLVDTNGNELDMGTEFDSFGIATHTDYFEHISVSSEDSKRVQCIRDNRRLLYDVMTHAGFINLPSEWWHFDYGDRFWAYYTNRPAIYAGVFSRSEM